MSVCENPCVSSPHSGRQITGSSSPADITLLVYTLDLQSSASAFFAAHTACTLIRWVFLRDSKHAIVYAERVNKPARCFGASQTATFNRVVDTKHKTVCDLQERRKVPTQFSQCLRGVNHGSIFRRQQS